MFDHHHLSSEEEERHEGGITLEMVAEALFIWLAMQGDEGNKMTVATAAMMWNASARLICDAVALNPEAAIRPEGETSPTKQFIVRFDPD